MNNAKGGSPVWQNGQEGRALDGYLVVSAQLGDRKALGLLVSRWHRKLVAHAWRLLGDGDTAADVVQEAWAEILRGLNGLKDADAFAPWAYRIVSRRAARAIAARQHRRSLAAALASEPEMPPEAREDSADIARLRAAIRALPGEQRAAVALFYLEDMSIAEVAVALDVPAGTVKTRLMHARHKLRAMLEGE